MKKSIHFSTSLLFVCIFLFQMSSFAQSTTHSSVTKTCPGKIDVWPGDTDNDTYVNNEDLLQIGIYYGVTGIPRDSVSNLFASDSSQNWGPAQLNGNDIKHADCNGDGVIDANDTLAISLNLNFERPVEIVGNPNSGSSSNLTANAERSPTLADMLIITPDDSYNAGEWVDAEIWLGDSATQVDKLYGLAFNINFDASLVQPGTESITFSTSWLNPMGTTPLKFSNIDVPSSIAHGAVTRIDHLNGHGYGKVADFKFQINTNFIQAAEMELSFSKYIANDSAGNLVLFNTFSNAILLNSNVGIKEHEKNQTFDIAPNPFNYSSTLRFNESQDNSLLKIIDVVGKTVKETNFSGKELIIEKGEMPEGIYFLQITNKHNDTFYKKIVIQ